MPMLAYHYPRCYSPNNLGTQTHEKTHHYHLHRTLSHHNP